MKPLIQFLYIFSATNAIAITILLYASKDGWLRKLLLFYFISLSVALTLRFLSWRLGWEGQAVTMIIMVPVAVSLFSLTVYLYKIYNK